MKLIDLLEKLEYRCERGSVDTEITGVCYDSRKVTPGCLFVCMAGANFDGHDFAAGAAEQGAAAVVVSRDVTGLFEEREVTVIRVENTRYALAFLSAAWFGHPAKKLTVIGITGTKGKTTTSYLVRSILEHAGIRCGLVGTIETIIGDEVHPAVNTTPESYVLFTNLEPDHIGANEHASFEDYLACKSLLFRQCRIGIVNGDDVHTDKVLEGHTCEVETYGMGVSNLLRAENLQLVQGPGRLGVAFRVAGLLEMEAEVPTPGRFSVYNAL